MTAHFSAVQTQAATRRLRGLSAGALLAFVLLMFALAAPARLGAQVLPEVAGRVEGSDFTIESMAGLPPAAGEAAKLLTNGSHLVVRSGHARISLAGGGEIEICGPARLQVLKSNGGLTIALDFGTLHLDVEGAQPISIFTPLVLATPVGIGGGEREATIGLENSGQMCLRAISGAVRVEQQLSGQSLLVPQLGGLSLAGGQLSPVSATSAGCACDLDAAKVSQPAVIHDRLSLSPPMPPPHFALPVARTTDISEPPSVDIPDNKVLIPALVFNSTEIGPPPGPSPETIYLVQSVNVKEDTIFHGTVESKENGKKSAPAAQSDPNNARPKPGIFARLGGFFRRVLYGSD